MGANLDPHGYTTTLPVTDLLRATAEACVAALAPGTDRDWQAVRAVDLEWTVWDTVVHINDCLYFYAAQILLADPDDYICLELKTDEHADPPRLLAALTAHTELLAAAVRTADPGVRAHHLHGASDPDGFAAMGMTELLVHTHDAVLGLDPTSAWRPPDDAAAYVLGRLFPHAPSDTGATPRDLLLYVSGRTPLGDRQRLTDWRWYAAPPGDSA